MAALEKKRKELAEMELKRKAQRLVELKKAKVRNPEVIVDFEFSMVSITGGTFKMGCTVDQIRECEGDERPVKSAQVADFKISKFEVTQELWDAVMDTNVSVHAGCAKCPVENIRYGDVQVFISKLNKLTGKNYRLPTEAEWEYAARGGQKAESEVPSISQVAWYSNNSGQTTHEVGQLKPNALGLYDMLGNVWEYCSDWYDPTYYSTQNLTNPKGPLTGAEYVIRGGSFFSAASECRVANRNSIFPIMAHKSYGFRLAE
ncbi:MAG: formylglycine-generating enzyme family protein [Bacteroidetes bacterium]|nr:MAG: formylglycine-generating enzyme family protein [Bacteroidota bacterium]